MDYLGINELFIGQMGGWGNGPHHFDRWLLDSSKHNLPRAKYSFPKNTEITKHSHFFND